MEITVEEAPAVEEEVEDEVEVPAVEEVEEEVIEEVEEEEQPPAVEEDNNSGSDDLIDVDDFLDDLFDRLGLDN
jgi:hypothetical protein